jgi:hypothetical protein
MSVKMLNTMQSIGLTTISFDIDDDGGFLFRKAVRCGDSLATIEHVLHVDHFLRKSVVYEDDGYLYLSASGIQGSYLLLS